MNVMHQSMASHGLNSLRGAELRDWIIKDFGGDIFF